MEDILIQGGFIRLMKRKFSRILGVALPFMMVLSLALVLLPASAPTAEAAVENLRFSKIPIPKHDSSGKYVLTPSDNVDTTECPNVGPIAIAPGGSLLFAAEIAVTGNAADLFKSTDSGYTWTKQAGFQTATAVKTDNSTVVGIELSPEYSSDTTCFVATQKWVYQTVDGGTDWSAMDQPSGWNANETITDMDIALDSGGRLSVIIGSNETSGGAGEVYVYSPATTGMGWEPQDIGASYNVTAAAFSPFFADDEGIFAVTINGTATQIQSSFGYTKNGGGWGVDIGDGEFLDRDGNNIATTSRARIAFPDDFDVDSTFSNVAFVGLYAGTSDGANTAELGDVYKVIFQSGTKSSTVDLDVRGLISSKKTSTNIYSIAVSGDAESATIMAGTDYWSTGATNYYWLLYYSNDGGNTWFTAREKQPTGGTPNGANSQCTATTAKVNVLISPDFATSNVAYASTAGLKTSALSRTGDGGKSWNQISLIDYANFGVGADNYTLSWNQVVSPYSTTKSFFLVTQVDGAYGACWKTTNAGTNYERIWSYANPTVTPNLKKLNVTKDNTVFVVDYTAGKFWRSTDGGATFPRVITAKATSLTNHKIVDPNTIMTVDATSPYFWATTKLGRPWVEPEESDIEGTPSQIQAKGDIIMVPTYTGKVFISFDAGLTFEKLGVNSPGTAYALTTFDSDYATNHYAYASQHSAGGGIWRIEVDADDPDSTEWKQIDTESTNAPRASTVDPTVMWEGPGNVFYVYDNTAVNVSSTVPDGGIWRCTNNDAELDVLYPPEFHKVNTPGLVTGDKLGYKGLTYSPNTLFFINSNPAANYYDRLVAFADTLSSPVNLLAPADKATGAGISLSTTDLTMDVVLSWGAMSGATNYKYQVATDSEFESADTAEFSGQQRRVSSLIPGNTYYWRVRAEDPVVSPWSATRSFTLGTAIDFGLVSPAIGTTDVSVMPTFVWSKFAGAISYEVMVSEDPTFAIIDWSRSVQGGDTTFYKAEEALAYDTTYYWRVRGVTGPAPAKKAAPGGAWATGMFTTQVKAAAEAEAPAPPVIVQKEPAPPPQIVTVEVPGAAAIPSYLLWTIIGIGAILFIALIVLIVRTRRVT